MRKYLLPTLTLAVIAAAQQARRVDDTTLRNAGKTGEEWLTYGATPEETRYSPLTQINSTNESLGPGMVLRPRCGRRQSGRDAAGVERHDLRHHELERGFRARRTHR